MVTCRCRGVWSRAGHPDHAPSLGRPNEARPQAPGPGGLLPGVGAGEGCACGGGGGRCDQVENVTVLSDGVESSNKGVEGGRVCDFILQTILLIKLILCMIFMPSFCACAKCKT